MRIQFLVAAGLRSSAPMQSTLQHSDVFLFKASRGASSAAQISLTLKPLLKGPPVYIRLAPTVERVLHTPRHGDLGGHFRILPNADGKWKRSTVLKQ